MEEKILEEKILDSISKEKMDELLMKFSTLHRLTGTSDEKMAAEYIKEKLDEYGIENELFEFDSYLSNPVLGELTVLSSEMFKIKAKTRSFSGNFPEGLEGTLVLIDGKKNILSPSDENPWNKDLTGKIVISRVGRADAVKRAEEKGAIGLIHVWTSEEEHIHELTASHIWGTPTLNNFKELPKIPILGINKKDGEKLIEIVNKEEVKVKMKTIVDTKVEKVRLPIATIKGKKDGYILLSGHLDSWYEGVTDNAVGNALCLELARVFEQHKNELNYGLKIAWWPGHSNGRYSGSTWFCDNFWEDLTQNCIAHINVDSPGCMGAEVLIPRTTFAEGEEFTGEIIKKFTGDYPKRFDFAIRGGDQSFWGVNIPIHIMLKYEQALKHSDSPGSGGGWWWHTEADTYDKVDLNILLRDSKVNAAMILKLANSKIIPVKLTSSFAKMKKILQDIENDLNQDFSLKDIKERIETIEILASKFESNKESFEIDSLNKKYKTIAGTLNRIIFSTSDEYNHDPAWEQKPFPKLQMLREITMDNTSPEEYLFCKNEFLRQKNRILGELNKVKSELS